jgi:hypothetical protein
VTKDHIKGDRQFSNLVKRGNDKLSRRDFERIRKVEAELSGIQHRHRDCRGALLRVGDIVTFAASANPNRVFKGTIEVLCPNNTKAVTVKISGMFPKTIPTDWVIAERTIEAEHKKKEATEPAVTAA